MQLHTQIADKFDVADVRQLKVVQIQFHLDLVMVAQFIQGRRNMARQQDWVLQTADNFVDFISDGIVFDFIEFGHKRENDKKNKCSNIYVYR
jgi:hypothetical protein